MTSHHQVATTSNLVQRVQERREALRRLLDEAGAREARLIGSVARGTAGVESDVDLLVDLPADIGGFAYLRLLLAVEDLLGCRVDLISSRGLPPAIREVAEREAVPL